MIREEIKKLVQGAIKKLQEKKFFPPGFDIPEINIEHPKDRHHGDYAINTMAIIDKRVMTMPGDHQDKEPDEIAGIIKKEIKAQESKFFYKYEAVRGFINFYLSEEYLQKQVGKILKEEDKFGQLEIGKNQKVNVEFISANPTGPLHIGNGRGGYCGDVLAGVLEKAGYDTLREYYVNDMGRQAEYLENSLNNREPSYKNSYIDELNKKEVRDVKRAIKFIVEKIKETTERMGIKFDKWFYESELYNKKEVDKIIEFLEKNNLIYEKDDALWFKSTKFGDDKDRVLIKKNEKQTYFLSDIAYIQNKFKRGFEYLIFFWGAEHHGYINRLKAVAQALGYDKSRVQPVIMQLVELIEKGHEVKMSKRTGLYVTIDELIDEVGKDVARFFFLTRSPGSHLIFDMDLAKEQSEKNPVYYIQYAHARICSIFKQLGATKLKSETDNLKLLNHPSEHNLIKELIKLPEVIEDTAKDYQIQRIPQYALDLAAVFHHFYRDCKVLTNDENLKEARLNLVLATQIVLRNTLNLMGISAPEKM